ncbi:MAG: beta-lactamase family protein [Oscillospiraceae bacterium]|nr:beta-lactamase family protein [Oscillospiraceae bacterium]
MQLQLTEQQARDAGVNLERLRLLDATLREWVEKGYRPTINTIIYRNGIPVFSGSYGVKGRDMGPLTMDAIFAMASITKPVIAALMVLLQEDGVIDLNYPVKLYYPDFQVTGDEEQAVNIWFLLTHTSGLDDEGQSEAAARYVMDEMGLADPREDDYKNWRDIMLEARKKLELPLSDDPEKDADDTWYRIQLRTKLTYRPRGEMRYCSLGYEVCKRIILHMTGESIDSFARRRLFEPLGMKDTYWRLPEEKWDRVIRRTFEEDSWFTSPECFTSESGGGGLKSTAPDMIRFCEMLRRGGTLDGARIFSPITVRSMLQNYNGGMGGWGAWALGFNYRADKYDDTGIVRPPSTVDHAGSGGVKLLIDRENKLSWVFFTAWPPDAPVVFNWFTNLVYSALDDL